MQPGQPLLGGNAVARPVEAVLIPGGIPVPLAKAAVAPSGVAELIPLVVAAMTFPLMLWTPWVPKFDGPDGAVSYRGWKSQLEATIQSQALKELQQTDVLLQTLGG